MKYPFQIRFTDTLAVYYYFFVWLLYAITKNCTCIKYFFSILFIIWAGYKILPFCVCLYCRRRSKNVSTLLCTQKVCIYVYITLYIYYIMFHVYVESIHDVAKYRVAHKDSIARNCVLHSTWCILFRHHHIYRERYGLDIFPFLAIPSCLTDSIYVCLFMYFVHIYTYLKSLQKEIQFSKKAHPFYKYFHIFFCCKLLLLSDYLLTSFDIGKF